MNFKKTLLGFAAGALALSLAACSEKEDSTKDKQTQGESKQAQEAVKSPTKEEQAAAKEMQAKLSKQQVDESKIVAVVNDEELAGTDYNAALMSIQGQMQQAGQDPTSKEAAKQVKTQALDMLVNQTLILQKAKEADLSASEKEIDEKYVTFEEQFGGEKGLKEAIKAQNMDIKALKKQIGESILFE
ncbi:MAG: SurA N-terminal domain-containing protein, partial [Bacillus sp. (in: Bacteria)]|nr:SurA N-terminal domain-containing protein [Bacillus sp. (in: firmicutes)]